VVTVLTGERIALRPAVEADVERLIHIRSTPEVHQRWRGDDLSAEIREDIADGGTEFFVIEDRKGQILGAIQFHSEEEPDYRHAGIDIYLHPDFHGQGICTEAVRTLARHLFDELGHHRITIDPAVDNVAAIRCYSKVGFRNVGVMRQYERSQDGSWHDGLLMELLSDEFDRRQSSTELGSA
jgi:aminoglycoside 6'-N-acetyltransferase